MILACILILFAGGCVVIPLPSKPDPSARFSSEELLFLNAPDATRAEAVSTLGAPLLDVPDPGVMVYTRAKIERSYIAPVNEMAAIVVTPAVSEGPRHAWVLLIAYDQSGRILAHEVQKLDTGDLNQMSLQWRMAKGRSR